MMTKAAELVGKCLENLDRYGWVQKIGIMWQIPSEVMDDLRDHNITPMYDTDWIQGVCLTGSISVAIDYGNYGFEDHGFSHEDRDEAYCAILDVIREQYGTKRFICPSDGDLVEDVIHIHDESVPDCSTCIILFNDHPDTTFADVKLVLEKAKIQLEEMV